MGLPPRDKAATRPRRVQTFISYHGQAGAAAWRSNQSRGGGEESQGGADSAKGAGYDDQAHAVRHLDPAAGKETYEPEEIHSLQRSTLTDHLTQSVQF